MHNIYKLSCQITFSLLFHVDNLMLDLCNNVIGKHVWSFFISFRFQALTMEVNMTLICPTIHRFLPSWICPWRSLEVLDYSCIFCLEVKCWAKYCWLLRNNCHLVVGARSCQGRFPRRYARADKAVVVSAGQKKKVWNSCTVSERVSRPISRLWLIDCMLPSVAQHFNHISPPPKLLFWFWFMLIVFLIMQAYHYFILFL